jgi:hypothetical protein
MALAAAAFATAAVAVPTLASAGVPDEIVYVTGAIKDKSNAQYVQAPVDKSVPALPVVYESKDGK